jgi:hypothetical protein
MFPIKSVFYDNAINVKIQLQVFDSFVQWTAHKTVYSSNFKGISVNIELQV